MIARLGILYTQIRNSLWALPIAICIGGGALAVIAARLEIRPGGDPVWWLYSGDATTASAFISNLLSAMITMATLAVSITMVVLTLAAQSLGPRLIPIFMGDTRTKLALGLFLGTVVYLLLLLRSVVGDSDSVPNLAVTIGTSLVLTCVLALLFFVHHLSRSIVADTIIERVGQTLDTQIKDLLPEQTTTRASLTKAELRKIRTTGAAICSNQSGYVQLIDYDGIGSIAAKEDAIVLLRVRPGHLTLSGETLGWISPPSASKEVTSTITNNVVFGLERTSTQDLEYSIRQLVEIALRALSPGINDPYTACAVIDRLTVSINILLSRNRIPGFWRDDKEKMRICFPVSDFSSVIDASFDEIRRAGASMPSILIRLIDRYSQLMPKADAANRREIRRHIELVRKTGLRGLQDTADRKELEQRIRKISESG
jgi:uncharacterized membrane protein